MDYYPSNRKGYRPYYPGYVSTHKDTAFVQGANCKRTPGPSVPVKNSCSCSESQTSMYEHLSHLPVAMAYVPYQKNFETFELCYALQAGTIFPELCKPFCGKRGNCR